MKHKMKTFYLTFNELDTHPKTGDPLKDHWIEIRAIDKESARIIVANRFYNSWSQLLYKQEFDANRFPGGRYERLPINDKINPVFLWCGIILLLILMFIILTLTGVIK